MKKTLLRCILLLLFVTVWGGGSYAAIYKTLTFPDDNKDNNTLSAYTETWTAKIGDDSWSISNFSNFYWGWGNIRCGRSGNVSVASIATNFAMDKEIESVVVTIDAITSKDVNSIYLVIASDADFSTVKETVEVTTPTAKCDLEFKPTTLIANCYYKLVFDCKKSSASNGGKNGFVQVSKVVYNDTSVKEASTVSFGKDIDNQTITVQKGQSFTSPTATLTPTGAGTLAYTSSNTSVATVDDNGTITFGDSYGTTDITATFAGNDSYESSSATYTIDYGPKEEYGTIKFSNELKSFDNVLGSYKDSTYSFVAENGNSYSFTVTKACKSSNCLQLKASEGIATSPTFGFTKGYSVTVFTIKNNVSIKCGELTATGTNGVVTLDVTDDSPFTLYTGTNYTQISKIVIVPNTIKELSLSDQTTNNIVAVTAEKVALTRTLSSEYWNTFCIPFAMTADQIKDVFGDGTVLTTFAGSVADNVMTFTTASSIEAGKPYLIKPAQTTANPTIENVTIVAGDPSSITTGKYAFTGVYNPTALKTDGTNLFVTKTGALSSPAASTNTMYGMRAYITVPAGTDGAKISFFDEATGISSLETVNNIDGGAVYNLRGQKVSEKNGLAKGLYIRNGKKFIVK